MTKLFEVEYFMTIVVEDEHVSHAYQVAQSNIRNAMSDSDPEIDVVRQINSLDQLPKSWDGICLPYGGNGEARIKDLLP